MDILKPCGNRPLYVSLSRERGAKVQLPRAVCKSGCSRACRCLLRRACVTRPRMDCDLRGYVLQTTESYVLGRGGNSWSCTLHILMLSIYTGIDDYKSLVSFLFFSFLFFFSSSLSELCLLHENDDGGLVRRMRFSRVECRFNVLPPSCSYILYDGFIFPQMTAQANSCVTQQRRECPKLE